MSEEKTSKKPTRVPYHEELANRIIDMLEKGVAPWQQDNVPGVSHAPRNPESGVVYKGVNRVALAMSGFSDPRWMTLKQANDAGFSVKKGSKSTPIVYYQFQKEQDKLDENGKPVLGEDGNPLQETVKLERPVMRFSRVFNASQIENYPPLEKSASFEWDPIEKAEKILSNSGATIIHENRDYPCYRPRSDEIHMPFKEQFSEASKYYASALHELGHWTGHESRLNRPSGPYGSEVYAKEELRAEISSWMVGDDTGIGYDPGNHAAYVEAWIKVLKDDPLEIMRACRDAEKIRDYVLGLEMNKEQTVEQVQDAEMAAPESTPEETNIAAKKIWLNVPFAEKDQAKAAGASWDNGQKQWFAPKGTDLTPLKKYLPTVEQENTVSQASPNVASEKTWLHVPFNEKEKAKAVGARWDKMQKQWYAPQGTDLTPLKAWLSSPDQQRTEQSQIVDPRQEFAVKLSDLGLDLKGKLPELDGQLHRVPLKGRSEKDGAYCLYGNGVPAGWAQNYSTGEKVKLVASGVVLSPEERERQQRERQERLEAAAKQRAYQHDAAAQRCEDRFKHFSPIITSAYLADKGVKPYGVKQDKENLIVPMRNIDGEFRGFQAIGPDGTKAFATGIEKRGNFHLINEQEKDLSSSEIQICEGYATGASLHEATGLPVVVAFDSGNLLPVAEAIREKYPNAAITICADNDHANQRDGKPYNVGVEKAKEAAQKVSGRVKVPLFTNEEKAKGMTDFNDLHKSRGLNAVKAQTKSEEKELSR